MSRPVIIAKEASVSLLGFIIGQLVRFGYNLAAARLLGAEYLGIYALVIAVVQIAEVVATGGLDSGLLRFVNIRGEERKKSTIASGMRMGLFFSITVLMVLSLASGSIARVFHGNELFRMAVIAAACAIPLNVMTSLAAHAIQGYRQLLPKMIATQLIAPAALLISMVVIRYAAGKEAALLVPFIPVALMSLLWIWPRLRRVSGIRVHDLMHARHDRELLKMALPLMAISLFSMMTHWLDVVMLGFLCDTRTVGLYQPAARTAGVIRSVLLAFAGIAAPMIADFHGRGQVQEIQRLYDLVTRWIIMIVIPPALILLIIPGQVLGIFGPSFTAGAPALVMLCATALMQAFFGLGSTVLAMTGLERISFINQWAAFLLQAVLHLLLIPLYGLNGAALSSLIVMALLSVARMVELHYALRLRPLGIKVWKPLLAGAFSGAVLLICKPWISTLSPFQGLGAAMVAGWGVYLVLIRKFRLEQDELDVIFRFMPFLNKESNNKTL